MQIFFAALLTFNRIHFLLNRPCHNFSIGFTVFRDIIPFLTNKKVRRHAFVGFFSSYTCRRTNDSAKCAKLSHHYFAHSVFAFQYIHSFFGHVFHFFRFHLFGYLYARYGEHIKQFRIFRILYVLHANGIFKLYA